MRFIITAISVAGGCVVGAADAQVFVSPTGDNSTGTSWATAFNDVAAGVTSATSLNEDLWIAEGTYAVTAAMTLPAGISVLGGFPATGNPGLVDRDTDAHATFLDGQLSNHIFQCSNVTGVVIDGLQFTQAGSDIGAGGAIRVVNASDVTVNDCRFFDNTASQYGAGLYIESAHAEITDSVFTSNDANEAGAVMLFNGTATITSCLFDGNDGSQGGAILAFQEPVIIDRCVFDGNTAMRGGAVAIREGTGSRISNTLFVGNSASDHGAGLNLESQQAVEVVNCTFVDNTATTRGGGVFFHDSDGFVTNCIFVNNSDHAIYENSVSADPVVRNNLFFGNPDGVYFDEDATSIASGVALNALVEASGNLDGDPIFVNAGAGDYHIDTASPARNAGIKQGAPIRDIDDEFRDALVDIGFDEVEPSLPLELTLLSVGLVALAGVIALIRKRGENTRKITTGP
jgi:hypothetical protein